MLREINIMKIGKILAIVSIIIIFFFSFIIIGLMSMFDITFETETDSAGGDSEDVCIVSGNIDNEKVNEKWKGTAGTKIEDKLEYIIKSAEENKIDPAIFISIIVNETGYGKASAVETHNNVAGMMGSGDLFKFDSVEDGIDAAAKNLYDLYFSEGLTNLEDIGAKYAPLGVENDPTNLNANWVPNNKAFVSEITSEDEDSKEEDCSSSSSSVNAGSIKELEELLKENSGKLPKYKKTRVSDNNYAYLQCTWYVYNRRKELGLPVEKTFGDGAEWAGNAEKSGYETSKEPKVGAMASWPRNNQDFGDTTYGHVAFVEEVFDDGSIRVSEYHVIPNSYGERTFKPKSDITFIY